ncbi:hypothetical protein FDECE_16029 [Fusarium decemcellulare]|nr:hypothetical protein FDECE_16029 [Fusarium decemcellulare]
MVSLRTLLGVTAIFTSVSAQNQQSQSLQVVWSSGAFETISGPGGGNEIGHDSGFAITDADGVELYSAAYPGDHAPCYNTGDGRTFTLTSTCWSRERKFKCKAKFDGNPDTCSVLDSSDNTLAEGTGDSHITFIGIAISSEGSCGVSFLLEPDEHCDDKAEWTVS